MSEETDCGGYVIPILEKLPPADTLDPVVEIYKKDIDRSLLRENLELTIEERILKLQDFVEFLHELRRGILAIDRRSGPDPSGG